MNIETVDTYAAYEAFYDAMADLHQDIVTQLNVVAQDHGFDFRLEKSWAVEKGMPVSNLRIVWYEAGHFDDDPEDMAPESK